MFNTVVRALASVLFAACMAAPAVAVSIEEMELLDAAHYCNLGEMEQLLAKGVDPNVRGSGGHTPLVRSVSYGECPEGVRMLLDFGADPSIENDSGQDAFDIARMYRYTEIEGILGGVAAARPVLDAPAPAISPAAPDLGWGVPDVQDEPVPDLPFIPAADGQVCKQMYLSCQQTCGYFSGGQWVMDYSCTAQCAECNRACEAGHVTACTNENRPWGGQ